MSTEERVKYWLDSAEETRVVAEKSFTDGHYDWAFFQWHLAIEKLLKGLIAKRDETPPYVHDLVKLAAASGVSVSDEKRRQLAEITTYSINARYDDYKRRFYKKVNEIDYREKWRGICQEIFIWIKNRY